MRKINAMRFPARRHNYTTLIAILSNRENKKSSVEKRDYGADEIATYLPRRSGGAE
jgi:hypothetical protein